MGEINMSYRNIIWPEDYCLVCPHCGAQSMVDPALLRDESPMPYCEECDKPLIVDNSEDD